MADRLYDANARLVEFFRQIGPNDAFVWGTWDCFAFGGGCVEAVTGENPFTEHEDMYDSETSAATYLAGLGFSDVEELMNTMFETCHISQAWIGDLVLITNEHGRVGVGCIIGEQVAGLRDVGYGTMDRTFAKDGQAYKVGH